MGTEKGAFNASGPQEKVEGEELVWEEESGPMRT